MHPYIPNDPDVQKAMDAQMRKWASQFATPFKRFWLWLKEPAPPLTYNSGFTGSMGFGGLGGVYPTCDCASDRDHWDLPPHREDAPLDALPKESFIISGLPISNDLQKVFGHFGQLTALVVSGGGDIEAFYEQGIMIRFLAITGPIQGIDYERV